MNTNQRKDMALFRYQLIAPLVRQTERGKVQAVLCTLAKVEHTLPDGFVRRFSIRTLERYLSMYRKGGLDALMPEERNDRSRPRALPQAVITRAIELRREQPARTVEQLIVILESENLALAGTTKRSTLASHLLKAGAQRHARTTKPSQAHQRYGALEVHEVWQCDVCDSLRIPDLEAGGQMRIARLTAILDDRSRYLCQAAFAFRENLPVIEDVLRKAVIRYGTPKIFYCDNAKVYRSHQLAEVAARLSFEVRHTAAYRPQGRGKLEKFFGYVERSFRPEAELCVKQGKITSLAELNRYFTAWLETMYHQRVHSTLKKSPAAFLAAHQGTLRFVDSQKLAQAFLWSHTAKVDKTACISVQGNTYEVEPGLARQQVELRYDPFDLSEIQVWFHDKRYANATPLKLRRHTDKRVAPPLASEIRSGTPSSFLDSLVKGTHPRRVTSGISYASATEGEVMS